MLPTWRGSREGGLTVPALLLAFAGRNRNYFALFRDDLFLGEIPLPGLLQKNAHTINSVLFCMLGLWAGGTVV